MYYIVKKRFQKRNELRTEELSKKCEAADISLSSPGGDGVDRIVALPFHVILPQRRRKFAIRGTDGSKTSCARVPKIVRSNS
jgi:hypothetical protein